jgi:hypothetical protein
VLATKSKKIIIRDYIDSEYENKMVYSYKDSIEYDLEIFKAVNMEDQYLYVICMKKNKCVVVKYGLNDQENSARVINLGFNLISDVFGVFY